jgi:putative tryptophan/tyrosine transport system substrate-binding protein
MRLIGLAVVLIRRRHFLRTVGLSLLAAPLVVEAQPAKKAYRMGYFSEGKQIPSPQLKAFEESLRELGYEEGKNLVVERRYAEFNYDRLSALAADLVRLKPDVIVTGGSPTIAALKRATTTVPIVMAWSIDPVGAGVIASLARPGGNVTGTTLSTGPEFIAKQLEILNEVVPKRSRVAVLRHTGRGGAETAAIETAARKLGMTVLFTDVRIASDLEGAFVTMTQGRAGSFVILGGPMTWLNRQQIAEFAVRHRLPGIHFFREYAEAGLLLAYGPSAVVQYRRAAIYVHKILQGAKPADLPVEEPTKFDLVINLKTAKALGLTIPQSILIRADQVIE